VPIHESRARVPIRWLVGISSSISWANSDASIRTSTSHSFELLNEVSIEVAELLRDYTFRK
jgi:hypothetical protein